MAAESLTNERIAKRFPNQFEMVNYLIALTQKQVRRGHEPEGGNVALEVIADVRQGFDLYALEAEKAPVLEEDDDHEEIAAAEINCTADTLSERAVTTFISR